MIPRVGVMLGVGESGGEDAPGEAVGEEERVGGYVGYKGEDGRGGEGEGAGC